jgi:hypothetical protein
MPRPETGLSSDVRLAKFATGHFLGLIRAFFQDAFHVLGAATQSAQALHTTATRAGAGKPGSRPVKLDKRQTLKRYTNRLQVQIAQTDIEDSDLSYIYEHLPEGLSKIAAEFSDINWEFFGEACYWFQTTSIVTKDDPGRDFLKGLCDDVRRDLIAADQPGTHESPRDEVRREPIADIQLETHEVSPVRAGAGNPPRDRGGPRWSTQSGAGNPPRDGDGWHESPQSWRDSIGQTWQRADSRAPASGRSTQPEPDRWRSTWDHRSWKHGRSAR